MPASSVTVVTAIRLGWAVAEVRGRHWPRGPRTRSTPMPLQPRDVLPLRSQRVGSASRQEALASLISLASIVELDDGGAFGVELTDILGALDSRGTASTETVWPEVAAFFLRWDARFQDVLVARSEALANGYLLGRGLAECFWGLGPETEWTIDGAVSAVSPALLLGADRRRELSRMLGRLEPGTTHELTPAAVAGSLEAWGVVVADTAWSHDPHLPDVLYEQVRRWYQLIVLAQDPTTLIRPYARLANPTNLVKAARMFWPQIVLALVSVALVAAFFTVVGGEGSAGPTPVWLSSLLATGGFGAFAAAGLLAKGQSAAQRLVTRLRQDAYTDLVAVSVTTVPSPPVPEGGGQRRRGIGRRLVEAAVRRRLLTTPTTPPPG
jgi:hypothetical protein